LAGKLIGRGRCGSQRERNTNGPGSRLIQQPTGASEWYELCGISVAIGGAPTKFFFESCNVFFCYRKLATAHH